MDETDLDRPAAPDAVSDRHGSAALSPTDDVVAGGYGTWTITYTVGEFGLDDGAALLVVWNQTADWGTPQFGDPSAPNYATVETSGEGRVAAEYVPDAGVRPFRPAVKIDVTDGSIRPGETVALTLGATEGGSPGHEVQTFAERDFEVRVLVDPVRTGRFVRLPDRLTFDVVSGPPRSLAAVLPAEVDPGEEPRRRMVQLRVRARARLPSGPPGPRDRHGVRLRDLRGRVRATAPAALRP